MGLFFTLSIVGSTILPLGRTWVVSERGVSVIGLSVWIGFFFFSLMLFKDTITSREKGYGNPIDSDVIAKSLMAPQGNPHLILDM